MPLYQKRRQFLVVICLGLATLLVYQASVDVRNRTPFTSRCDDTANRARKSINFVKMHKCASSTFQNVILRYGERNRLNFVLGGGGNFFGKPEPFKRAWIGTDLWPGSGKFDIMAHHAMLNATEIKEVLQPGAAFVTSLRDPVTQFESMWSYFGFKNKWNMSLTEFIKLPLQEKRANVKIANGYLGGNQMAFMLGYERNITERSRIDRMVAEVDANFDLVLLAEHIDQSLILLKHLMCWSTIDVVYLKQNMRKDEFKTTLSAEERARLEEFLVLDVALYRHFSRKFFAQLKRIPRELLHAELETLKDVRSLLNEWCKFEQTGTGRLPKYEQYEDWEWICSRLAMPEIEYTNLLRDQQRKRVNNETEEPTTMAPEISTTEAETPTTISSSELLLSSNPSSTNASGIPTVAAEISVKVAGSQFSLSSNQSSTNASGISTIAAETAVKVAGSELSLSSNQSSTNASGISTIAAETPVKVAGSELLLSSNEALTNASEISTIAAEKPATVASSELLPSNNDSNIKSHNQKVELEKNQKIKPGTDKSKNSKGKTHIKT